jgi:hypothetical protein
VTEYTQSTKRNRDKPCPECGELIRPDALVCPQCDARLVDDDVDDRPLERRRRRHDYPPHNGQMIMILGIISFVFMPHILGPVSWVMGYMELKKVKRGEVDPEAESPARTGMICGMISTILHGVILVAVLVIVGLVFGGACCFGAAATGTKGGTGTGTTNPPAQPSR